MTMKRIIEFLVDDSGQDLVEYAVTSGLITAGSFLVVFIIVFTMRAQYAGWETGAQAAWEPCAPGGCP